MVPYQQLIRSVIVEVLTDVYTSSSLAESLCNPTAMTGNEMFSLMPVFRTNPDAVLVHARVIQWAKAAT